MDGDRVVFHIDLDAFYAGVEMRDDPSLRHVPLVIGSDPQGGRGRGVVCTANYPARNFGIRSAMPISQAWRLAPHARFVAPDFSKYAPASDAVMQVAERYADVLEVVGMDEAYLDVSSHCRLPDGTLDWSLALNLAHSLQAAIARDTGLSCSIGIAPNKAVAKIATDRRKPHGITLVQPQQVRDFLDPLSVRCISGCGPKTASLLHDEGIRTIADLAGTPAESLERLLGSHGRWLHHLARGEDTRPVIADHGPRKSRGNETTFLQDERDSARVLRVAADLLEENLDGHDRRDRRAFTTITVKMRYSDFTTLTRAHSVDVPFEMDRSDTPARAWSLVKELLDPLLGRKAVRLVGVRLSNFLEPTGQRPLTAFGAGFRELAGPSKARIEKPRGAFDPGGMRQLVLGSGPCVPS